MSHKIKRYNKTFSSKKNKYNEREAYNDKRPMAINRLADYDISNTSNKPVNPHLDSVSTAIVSTLPLYENHPIRGM